MRLLYEGHTPGVECSDNTAVLLGDEGEPQPDLYLRVVDKCGGQSTVKDDYVEGAPEFVAEVANSSKSIDMRAKKHDYTRYGVQEYLVVLIKEGKLRWFDLPGDRELESDADGVFRSQQFPGLWINGPALLAKRHAEMNATLEAGLATDEHAAFVKTLAERKGNA